MFSLFSHLWSKGGVLRGACLEKCRAFKKLERINEKPASLCKYCQRYRPLNHPLKKKNTSVSPWISDNQGTDTTQIKGTFQVLPMPWRFDPSLNCHTCCVWNTSVVSQIPEWKWRKRVNIKSFPPLRPITLDIYYIYTIYYIYLTYVYITINFDCVKLRSWQYSILNQ